MRSQLVDDLLADLLQGCYKLLTACSKLVDNLGQAVRSQLVDGLLTDLLQGCYKLLTACSKLVDNLEQAEVN